MDSGNKGFSEDDQRSIEEPRQFISSSQSPEKTKKIGKNGGRPSKKQKRNQQDQKEGQGSSNEQKETDPCETSAVPMWEQFMAILIEFFSETLQKKGFVYTKETRAKYNNKLNDLSRFKWNQEIRWEKNAQFHKATNICREERRLSEAQIKALINVMVQSSAIFAEEFTTEYYQILLRVYLLTKREKEEGLNQDQAKEFYTLLAQEIFTNKDGLYYYFSYTFRTFHITLDEKFQRPSSDRPYRTLINALRIQMLQLP